MAITVFLDPQNTDLVLTVEVVKQDATIRWVKEEICKQDLTGSTTPESIRLSSVERPGVTLDDAVQITSALEQLVLKDSAAVEAAAEDRASTPPPVEEVAAPQVRPATVELLPVLVAPGECRVGTPCSDAASDTLSCEELAAIAERAARRAREDNDRRAEVAAGLKPAVRACWQKKWDQGLPSDYTFAVEDPRWVKYLKRHGFCVLADVLPEADSRELLDGFWSELAQVVPGLQRYDPSTWTFPGQESNGIARGYGLPQSDFAWAVRSHPQIKRVFELIYRTNQLVVSMDSLKIVGTGVREPGQFWLHRDQLKDVAAYSVQSIYTFFEVGPQNDGTILIPDSHKESHAWDEWQRSAKGAIVPMLRAHGRDRNNVRIPDGLQEVFMSRAIKPRVPANGMILFSSRTIHASSPDAEARWLREKLTWDPPPERPRPNRIAVSVSMCPRGRRSSQTLLYKMTLVKSQCSTTHWADDEVTKGKAWGREAGTLDGDFRMLPMPGMERERERFSLL